MTEENKFEITDKTLQNHFRPLRIPDSRRN